MKVRLLTILVLVAVAVVIIVWMTRQRGGESPSAQAPLVADDDHKVVFIGLDGATWDIIDPMLNDGKLPTFSRLKDEGAWGDLRSVDCYFSPPAWTAMMSGYLPERSGVYTFGKWLDEEQDFKSVSAVDVEVPMLWDAVSFFGKRVAVTNMPVTYPVRPINGIMVSGLLTPFSNTRATAEYADATPFDGKFDPELDARSFARPAFGRKPLDVQTLIVVLYDTTDDHHPNYDTVAMKVVPTGADQATIDAAPIMRFGLNEYSPWFQIDKRDADEDDPQIRRSTTSVKVRSSGPRIQFVFTPFFKLPSDPELEMTYPDSLGKEIMESLGYYLIHASLEPDRIPQTTADLTRIASYFYEYDDWDLFMYVLMAPDNIHHREGASARAELVYQEIDRWLGELVDGLGPNTTLILASDHGFDQYQHIIDLNKYFGRYGLTKIVGDLVFDGSLVFHERWCLYFNDALLTAVELARRGIPIEDGQTPRAALIRYLREICAQIKSPSGEPMPVELIDVRQDGAGLPPDMIVVGSYDTYFVEGNDLRIRAMQVVRPTRARDRWYHDREGLYLFWGDRAGAGPAGEKNIEDITPTILYLLGLPLAPDFDGKVMTDALSPGYLAERPIVYFEDYATLAPSPSLDVEELQSLEDKLRALGYIR